VIIASTIIENKYENNGGGEVIALAERLLDGGAEDCLEDSLLVPTDRNKGEVGIQQILMSELVGGRDGFNISLFKSWGSSDCEYVHMDHMWSFDEFIIIRKIHTPTVLPLGVPWSEFVCIPFSDVAGITKFAEQAGLNGPDPE